MTDHPIDPALVAVVRTALEKHRRYYSADAGDADTVEAAVAAEATLRALWPLVKTVRQGPPQYAQRPGRFPSPEEHAAWSASFEEWLYALDGLDALFPPEVRDG